MSAVGWIIMQIAEMDDEVDDEVDDGFPRKVLSFFLRKD
jgi:hypothetical protein